MDKTTVKCNRCRNDFVIGELKQAPSVNEVECVYFSCPHCQADYTAYYTNQAIRDRQAEINDLNEKVSNAKSDKTRDKYIEEIEALTKQNKQEMEQLRKEIEGGKDDTEP